MHLRTTVRTTVLVVAAAATLLTAAPAQAAPGETIPLDCGSAGTFDAVVNGNGDFTPGRIVGSTGVLVPIAFQNARATATEPGGEPVDLGGEPDTTKGKVAQHSKRPTVTCSFEQTFVLPEPEEGFPAGTVVTYSGEVVAFHTGR